MSKANTYQAERMLSPYGFSVTDVLVTEGNKKRPVTFKVIGDFIDLERTDIKTFIKSSVNGQLHKLFIGGALSSRQIEVSDRVEREIQEALSEFGMSNYADKSIVPAVKYMTLEPGVMVAVSQVPEITEPLPAPAVHEPPPQTTVVVEAGSVGPSGAAGGVEQPAVIVEEKPKSKKRKRVQEEEAESKSKYEDWKFNVDFQSQKRMIIEAQDQEFLTWVAANEDSVQFKKLAQTRLAEIAAK